MPLDRAIADARLGLTATPPRAKTVIIRLTELVGPLVYELAIADLTEGIRLRQRGIA